jgi:hypothetical protein
VSVGRATGYGLDDPDLIPANAIIFSSPQRPNRSEAHPASYSVSIWGYFPGVKQPEREADHSSLSSAYVKNVRAILPLPLCLHGIALK